MEDCYIIMKQRRQQLGLSQRALAKICGYTDHTTITKMKVFGVDCVVFTKLKEGEYSIDFAPIGTYEKFYNQDNIE